MKQILCSILCTLPVLGFGQILLYNDGAMVKVQSGATLFVEGGIQNTATGTIDNDGTIELQGNFVNAGTWEPSQPNTLKFSGTGTSDVTPGSAVFQTVVDQKGTGGNVNLLGNMTVNTNLDFASTGASRLILNNFDLSIGSAGTVTGYDSDEYVTTNGTGKMKKSYTSFGNFDFPVGFNATTYNPASLNVTAGPNDTYGVRVLGSPTNGNGLTGTPITSDVVDAVWDVSEGTAGGNTANLTLGWAESDELTGFDDLLNTVSYNDGVNGWDGLFANLGPEVSNTRTRNAITSFGAFAVGDKPLANQIVMAPKVFLQGPYNATTHLMADALRTSNFIPLTEPYSAAPFNYVNIGYGGGESVPNNTVFDQSGTNNDIVDWIIIEVRDQANPATKLATRTGLIQRDGDVVDLDGTSPLIISGLVDGTYHVGIKHRNHLPIRTQNALSLNGTSTPLDFSIDNFAYDNGSANNEPTATVETGVEAMWGGDVDNSNTVAYATGDRLAILNKVGTTTPSALVTGYNREDANMDGTVGYSTGDRLFVLNVVGTTTPSRIVSAHQ